MRPSSTGSVRRSLGGRVRLAARRHDGTAAAASGARPQGDPGLRVPRAVPRPARAAARGRWGRLHGARAHSGRRPHGPPRRRELPRGGEGPSRARVARRRGLADAVLWAYGDWTRTPSSWPSTASGWTEFGSCPSPGETPDVGHGRARGLRAAHRGRWGFPSRRVGRSEHLRRKLAQIEDLVIAAACSSGISSVMMPRGGAGTRPRGPRDAQPVRPRAVRPRRDRRAARRAAHLGRDLDPDSGRSSLIAVTRRDWGRRRGASPGAARQMTGWPRPGWRPGRRRGRGTITRASVRGSTAPSSSSTVTSSASRDGRALRPAAGRLRAGHAHRRGAPGERLRPALRDLLASATDEEVGPFVAGPYPREAPARALAHRRRAFGATEDCFRLDPHRPPLLHLLRDAGRPSDDGTPRTTSTATRSSRRCTRSGHGLYEHGGDTALDRTPLATGCSSALHESQSRLWENVIGRSLPFWRWFYPQFRDGFGSVLADVPLERFHRAINRAGRRSFAWMRTRRRTGSTSSCGSSSSRSFSRRRALDRRPARGLEREVRGAARRSGRRTTGSASSRTSTGQAACSGISRPTSWGTSSRCRSGSASWPTWPTRTSRSSRDRSARSTSGCASTSTGTGARFTPGR